MRLYDDLAAWWPLMSAPDDYAEEAAFYARLLRDAAPGDLAEVLELGSGGGNNASHMKARFDMTLVEPSAGMLDVSRALNPECEHVRGDMRTIRLGRRFDAVFIHDAIDYMVTREDARRAVETAFVHARPGAPAVFCPDHVADAFRPSTSHGGHDGEGRALRYLEWTRAGGDPETCVTDYAFLLEADGATAVAHDRHVTGLFPRSFWLRALSDAGLVDVRSVPFEHPDVEPGTVEVFVGVRPAAPEEQEDRP